MPTNLTKPSIFLWLKCSVYSFIFRPSRTIQTPKSIDKYHLIKEIKKLHFTNFSVGIYAKNGHKYFIKSWAGNHHDYEYFSLLNEYSVTKMLYKKSLKLTSSDRIYFAKPLEIKVTKAQTAVVYEYISGKMLASFTPAYQALVMSKILTALAKLSVKLTQSEKKLLFSRPFYWYLLLLPVRLISLSNRKFSRKSIAKSFFSSSFRDQGTYGSQLAHRDLSPENIHVTKTGKVYLLDCEQVCLTFPGFDLHSIYTNPLNKQLIRHFPKHSLSHQVLRLLSVHSMAGITNSSFVEYYSRFLTIY